MQEIIINQFIQSFSSQTLDSFFYAATLFGNPGFWFGIAAILFWLGKEKKSFVIASIVLFSGFISGALKLIIAKPRPEGIRILENEATASFPSTHSTLAAAISTYYYFSAKVKQYYKYLLVILAILTGISRLYLGVHFISDIIAGLFLGAIIGWFVFKLETKINKMHFHITKLEEEGLVILLFAIIIVAQLFLPAEFYSAYAILGYFVGYAIYKHTTIDLTKQTLKQKTKTLVGGIFLLGLIGLSAITTKENTSKLMFFIAGLFVTILWPAIVAKSISPRLSLRPGKAKSKQFSKK